MTEATGNGAITMIRIRMEQKKTTTKRIRRTTATATSTVTATPSSSSLSFSFLVLWCSILSSSLCVVVSAATRLPIQQAPPSPLRQLPEGEGEDDPEQMNNIHRIQLPRIEVQFVCESGFRWSTASTPRDAEDFRDPNSTTNTTTTNTTTTPAHNILNTNTTDTARTTAWLQQYYHSHFLRDDDTKNSTVASTSSSTVLYISLSTSRIHDVNRHEWYYPMCPLSADQSAATLVTIDVRGYGYYNASSSSSYGKESKNQNNTDINSRSSEHDDVDNDAADTAEKYLDLDWDSTGMFQQTKQTLQAYIENQVCRRAGVSFYRSNIRIWDAARYPMPVTIAGGGNEDEAGSSRCNVLNTQTNIALVTKTALVELPCTGATHRPYPSSSIASSALVNHDHLFDHTQLRPAYNFYEHDWTRNGYKYDHNLYILCGGAEEILSSDRDAAQQDTAFLVLAVLVGMTMLVMLGHELKPRSTDSSSSTSTTPDYSSVGRNIHQRLQEQIQERHTARRRRRRRRRPVVEDNEEDGITFEFEDDGDDYDDDDDDSDDDDDIASMRRRSVPSHPEIELANFHTNTTRIT